VTEPSRAKVSVALGFEQRSDAAAVAVLRALREVIMVNRDGSLRGEDPEHLHQLRIAVRRTRTVQRQFKGVFPPHELIGYRSEFRWLQRATGEARDLDVYVDRFGELAESVPARLRGDLEPLRMILSHWRLAARGETARALHSRRTDELLSDWEVLLESLVELPRDDRPDAALTVGRLVSRRLRAVYEQVLGRGREVGSTSPPAAYHELRKKTKELRYLLELFGTPLYEEATVGAAIRLVKRLQDVLGRHQDCEVQIGMLSSLAEEVAGLPGGPRAVLAMGVLIDRLLADQLAAREEFAREFAAFDSSEEHERLAAALSDH
jgi:CHAD domain-containing protein